MKRILYLCVCLYACMSLSAEVKYVFYFIGDGMGPNQVTAAEMYLAELDGRIDRKKLHITQLPYMGMVATHSHSNSVTDSSAAGTTLATGSKTNNGTLGIDFNGDTLTTIAERLKAQGWGVGLLTTVAIDHATPAAFYANNTNRDDYYNIGLQLVKTDFDFFGGAGFHRPRPRTGEWDNLYDLAEQNGYTIASGLSMAEQKQAEAKKMILVQPHEAIDRRKEGSNFPYCIDGRSDSLRLNVLTDFAIRFLEQKNERFFLMVEGGMMDYAGHSRDGATDILEMIDFDGAVETALAFYEKHPDETLIVVTADHETGGMALGTKKYVLNLQVLQHQHCSSWVLSDELSQLYEGNHKPKWQDVRKVLEQKLDFYGEVSISKEEDAELQAAFRKTLKGKGRVKTLYKEINALSGTAISILNRQAHLGWTSYGHTGASVPMFAIGQGAEEFTGWIDNTELVPKILKIAEGK